MSDAAGMGYTRTPPHHTQAEQSVLGSLMMDSSVFADVSGLIGAGDFYHPDHAAIFSTIQQLVQVGEVADVVTVFTRGRGHDLALLNGLAECVPSARMARQHAGLVREAAVRREVMAVGLELADAVHGGVGRDKPVADLIDAAVVRLLALMGGAKASEPRDVQQLLPPFIDALHDRAEGRNDAVPTGLRDVDRLLSGGFRPGELVVIGARPSMGKSALSLTIARNVAATHVVLVCSMEDSEQMLVSRQVAAAGCVNLADIRSPHRAPQSMWSGVATGVEQLQTLRLFIDDQPALSLADVRRKAAQVKRRAGALHLLVVDYLQLMQGDGDNRHQVLGAIAAGLKAMAKEYGITVVLLSQLNREADKTDSPPRLDHLRESGGIEEAADMVGLLWREHRRKPKPDNKHAAQIEFAKHKNGPTDTVRLWFDGATQRFCDAVEGSGYAQ